MIGLRVEKQGDIIMFLVCYACHKVMKEIKPLRSTKTKLTICEECEHETKLRYIRMLNEFYFEEQLIPELQADKDELSDPSQTTIKTTS
jgi:hypothetical protein